MKRVPFSMRQDLILLDKLDAETRFLAKHEYGTAAELESHKEKSTGRIAELEQERNALRNQLRTATRREDAPAVENLKSRIKEVSSEIKVLRQEVKLCDGIEARSALMERNLEQLQQEQEIERKEEEHMSYSGEAADQVVRLSLNGVEVAAKLSGSAAKQLAIMIYAILKDQKKTKGKIRLTNMLRSGKELKVFAVKDGDLQKFCEEAKKYGVLYCVLKDKNATDGIRTSWFG